MLADVTCRSFVLIPRAGCLLVAILDNQSCFNECEQKQNVKLLGRFIGRLHVKIDGVSEKAQRFYYSFYSKEVQEQNVYC